MVNREMPPLGVRLKALREAAGLSQSDLAGKAGVSVDIVRKIEQGHAADPKLSTLDALAEGLGLGLGQLVEALMRVEKKTRKRKEG